jgi:hypothetical protein
MRLDPVRLAKGRRTRLEEETPGEPLLLSVTRTFELDVFLLIIVHPHLHLNPDWQMQLGVGN